MYSGGMIEYYTLYPKPVFKDGDIVIVDMSHLGGEGLYRATIVGKGMEHILDFWLVQFDKVFGPTYPFKVVQVPHTAFIKSMPVGQLVEVLKNDDYKDSYGR